MKHSNNFDLQNIGLIRAFIRQVLGPLQGYRGEIIRNTSSFQDRVLDRELARFIYVREVKRFDPFKFSIYAWCIRIAIAGSLAPVRLAWVPFLGVPKNGFIYVEADTKKLYAGL